VINTHQLPPKPKCIKKQFIGCQREVLTPFKLIVPTHSTAVPNPLVWQPEMTLQLNPSYLSHTRSRSSNSIYPTQTFHEKSYIFFTQQVVPVTTTLFFKTKRKALILKIIGFWNIYQDNPLMIFYYQNSLVDFSPNLERLSYFFFSL
jgi:hypothetical protein